MDKRRNGHKKTLRQRLLLLQVVFLTNLTVVVSTVQLHPQHALLKTTPSSKSRPPVITLSYSAETLSCCRYTKRWGRPVCRCALGGSAASACRLACSRSLQNRHMFVQNKKLLRWSKHAKKLWLHYCGGLHGLKVRAFKILFPTNERTKRNMLIPKLSRGRGGGRPIHLAMCQQVVMKGSNICIFS